tara:strand:+ start:4582 stop:5067 length:486 start_codon:yes stop_codon:yes gene_type:complete
MREKDIDGFEGIYKIYEDGRIWSYKKEIFKSATPNNHNYYTIGLNKDKKRKTFSIHRLLAIHFIPNPNNLSEVDHIDRNRQNNDLSNLRWATKAENQENTIVNKNNQLREKNISKDRNGYIFKIVRNGIKKLKYFKTLEDGIDYRDSVLMYYEIHKTLEGI